MSTGASVRVGGLCVSEMKWAGKRAPSVAKSIHLPDIAFPDFLIPSSLKRAPFGHWKGSPSNPTLITERILLVVN